MRVTLITEEKYLRIVDYYREEPGNAAGAARLHGIDPKTAKRIWMGPPGKLHAWMIPAKDIFEREAKAKAKAEEAERIALQRAVIVEQENAKRLKAELTKVDEGIMRLARSDVVGALGSLSRLNTGINAMAQRINDMVVSGLDSTGAKLPDVSLKDGLQILQRYSLSVRALAEAARTVVEIDRLRNNLPTTILGVEVSHVTLEDAVREHEQATENIARARKLGMLGESLPAQEKH